MTNIKAESEPDQSHLEGQTVVKVISTGTHEVYKVQCNTIYAKELVQLNDKNAVHRREPVLVLGTERLCWPASALNSPALHLSAWTSVRALVVWGHPHRSSTSISRVSSGFVPSHFIDSCQCFLREMLHLFLSFRGFPLRTEAVKQQQIPMELGGFPKSDLDSQWLLCSQVFLPRLPFNYIFEDSVDPIQGDFGPFCPYATQDCHSQ